MAKGFKKGAGGANPMNFVVVGGTTAPANPKENTIWVNTSTDISSWVFSATQPESPAEGMVWILIDPASSASINVLKKNVLNIYPAAAMQYVGGAWAEKGAMSYQNGEWTGWSTTLYLYKPGDTCDSVTGGWVAYNGDSSITKGSASMTVKVTSGYKSGGAKTSMSIDFTGFNTLISKSKSSTTDFVIRVTKNGSVVASANAAGTKNVDVSGLSGNHLVEVYCSNSQSGGRNIEMTEIYLTR